MLLIKELKPSLNVQSDSIRAKLFTDAWLKYLHNIKHCGMRILHIQNLQLSHNNFDTSITTSILRMMFDTSKRRLTVILIFLIKCFNKKLIVWTLKRIRFVGKKLLESKTLALQQPFSYKSSKFSENSNCCINLLLNARSLKLGHLAIFDVLFPFLTFFKL